MKAFLVVLFAFVGVECINQLTDSMGNIAANILSNQGSGAIMQGGDANAGAAKYMNSVSGNGSSELVNAIAGNEDAVLQNDSDFDDILQNGDGNNNADNVENHVATAGDSDDNFNVANMDAKTMDAHGNNTVAQKNDNNNASNQFLND